ncbi:MAG: hypothetical protein ACOXZK_04120 [Bacteroidales bacterium]
MKKINSRKYLVLFVMILSLVFIACVKEDMTPLDKMANKMSVNVPKLAFPVAKVSDNGRIEHLFLQYDVQKYFSERNPELKLNFVEIVKEVNGKYGLIYATYDESKKLSEAHLVDVIDYIDGICYYRATVSAPNGYFASVTCKTSARDCSASRSQCSPKLFGGCEPCKNPNEICEKTHSSVTSTYLNPITEALYYGINNYVN